MPSSSNKSTKINIRRGKKEGREYTPKLQDFKRGDDNNIEKRGVQSQRALQARRMDDIFDTFRSDIEDVMNPWSSSVWRLPSVFRGIEQQEDMMIRNPIFDMVDKGDRYKLKVEVPGIDKEKIRVKATRDSIEISGEQSEAEKSEDKRNKYIYNERSYSSFYRSIPVPEEIVSSKVSAKMNNGILHVELPKKNPTKEEDEATTIEIK
jgi:HSP20 family protein